MQCSIPNATQSVPCIRNEACGQTLMSYVSPLQVDRESVNGAASVQQRGAPSRLRNWSGRLGSQITSLRGTLSPGADNVSNVTSTLKGLFQRQGSSGNGLSPSRPLSPVAGQPAGAHSRAETAAAGGGVGANSSQHSAPGGRTDRQSIVASASHPDANGARGSSSADLTASSGVAALDESGLAQGSAASEPAESKQTAQAEGAMSPTAPMQVSGSSRLPFDDSGFRDADAGRQRSSRPGSGRRSSQNGHPQVTAKTSISTVSGIMAIPSGQSAPPQLQLHMRLFELHIAEGDIQDKVMGSLLARPILLVCHWQHGDVM